MLLDADSQLPNDKRTINVLDGMTPLIRAIRTEVTHSYDGYKIVNMLLEANATLINITDPKGKTPLDLVIEYGYDRIITVLRAKGAKTSAELKENN